MKALYHSFPFKPMLLKSLLILGILGLLAACSGGSDAETAAPPQATVAEEELPPLQAPQIDEGLISYVSGIVDLYRGGEWIPAEIGDLVTVDESIRTEGDSSCELQFGKTAVIRIQENTEVALNRISLKPEANKVGIAMVAGTVLAKVEKLSQQDSFSVRTQSAVCGVRGTEFSVSAEEGQETVLAVKEGSVAVLPPALDPDELKDKVADKGESAIAAIDKLLEAAPRVEADQELELDEEFAEENIELTESMVQAVTEIAAAETEAEVSAKSDSLSQQAATTKVASKSAPREISPVRAETLKQTDKMEILAVPVAAEGETAAPQPEIMLYKIALKIEPSDAAIMLNGEKVGTGNFSALYQEGRSLNFSVSRDGYQSYELPVSVAPEAAKLYRLQLAAVPSAAPEPEPEPEPAAEPQAEPEPEAEAPAPATEIDEAEETVSEAETPPVEVDTDSEAPAEPVRVQISADPSDARISAAGENGRGSLTIESLPGNDIGVRIERRGFVPQEIEISVGTNDLTRSIRLEPRPILFSTKLGDDPFVGLAAASGTIVAADSKGRISAANLQGRNLWRKESANSPNENSSPVIIGNQVFFSGSKELIVVALRSGELRQQISLPGDKSHLFGRRVVPFGERVLYPANNSIERFNPASGAFNTFTRLEGPGSRMTPGIAGNSVVIADQEGLFIRINAQGEVTDEIRTAALQPIAQRVAVRGSLAAFSGRRGDVAAIDLDSFRVAWERKLADEGVSIAADLLITPEGVYAFSREGSIYGLSLADGSDLFTPIRGAAAAPAYRDGELIYGTKDGKLILASAASGATRRSLALGGAPSTRPVITDGLIALGTRQGRVLLIEPAAIE